MERYFADICGGQERAFKKTVMYDYHVFNRKYKDVSGFPFLNITTKEYELQNYYEKRMEHYIREILVNGVLFKALAQKGIKVYLPEIKGDKWIGAYYTNAEYEEIAKYEFRIDYKNKIVIYRYTDILDEKALELFSDQKFEVNIIQWDAPEQSPKNKEHSSERFVKRICIRDFFLEYIGLDEYQMFITFLECMVSEFQEFIGAKSVPILSPFSLGLFRFEVEKEILSYIETVRKYVGLDIIGEISYGYQIITDSNKMKYFKLEAETKKIISQTGIIEDFLNSNSMLYLIGGMDFSRSLITSEYLYKQYNSDDCFDYTAIVSGYLKSIEQLLFRIVCFAIDKSYRIKSNGRTKPNGKYPASSKKEGKIFKIDFTSNELEYVDTSIGSLIHFLDDNKEDLIIFGKKYRRVVIDALNCYRDECRNASFHLDNNYNWSNVEIVRWNTFFLYVVLLEGCKLGNSLYVTQRALTNITDNRLERLVYMISSGVDGAYEFGFDTGAYGIETMKVKHIAEESEFPSYDSIGRVKSVLLTFERLDNNQKVIITGVNKPEIMWYVDENGKKELI